MPTSALTGIHLFIDKHTAQHLLLCYRLFALQSPFQISMLSLHLIEHRLFDLVFVVVCWLVGFYC